MKSAALTGAPAGHRAADFLALAKPRVNALVVASAGAGYGYGALGAGGTFDAAVAGHVLLGCGLVAGGAAAFNQVAERDLDGRMERTRRRPIPAGRITPRDGRLFAAALSAAGLVELAVRTNLLAALVALATLVSYAAIYTPLKRRTPWATLAGAVPGALPPVIGWAAARGALTIEAWMLFGIVFLWQLPHVYALAWLYRDDLRRAGLPATAARDPDGRRTARDALIALAALVPVSLAPAAAGLAGPGHLAVAGALGAAFVIPAIRFRQQPSDRRARALFTASLVYLPALWGWLLIARGVLA